LLPHRFELGYVVMENSESILYKAWDLRDLWHVLLKMIDTSRAAEEGVIGTHRFSGEGDDIGDLMVMKRWEKGEFIPIE